MSRRSEGPKEHSSRRYSGKDPSLGVCCAIPASRVARPPAPRVPRPGLRGIPRVCAGPSRWSCRLPSRSACAPAIRSARVVVGLATEGCARCSVRARAMLFLLGFWHDREDRGRLGRIFCSGRPLFLRGLLLVILALALALPASAGAARHPWLSKAQAERDAETVALRSAHHIWRLSDITVESVLCVRDTRTVFFCGVTVGLHYSADECVPPIEAEARFAIDKVSRTGYVYEMYRPWEIDPVSASRRCASE